MTAVAEALIHQLILLFAITMTPEGTSVCVDYISNGKLVETIQIESQSEVYVVSKENQKLGSVEKLKSNADKYVWSDRTGDSSIITISESFKYEGENQSTVVIGKQSFQIQRTKAAVYLFDDSENIYVIRIIQLGNREVHEKAGENQ